MGIFQKYSLKCYKSRTKPTSYEVNHNTAHFAFKQKSIWKLDKKNPQKVLNGFNEEKTTIPWSIANNMSN